MTDTASTLTQNVPSFDSSSPLKIGSDDHKRAFCAVLINIFNPYKPAVLAWPKLSDDARKRLTDLPFWDVAVQTEGQASSRMQAMSDAQTDPLIKEAIGLNAFEEGRHKLVIRNMLHFYGIPFEDDKPYGAPRYPNWAFMSTGYGECLDSFFAFGLFKMAKDSGYFPPELVEVFEPVVQEEARHIMFFVNWAAWTAANKSIPGRIWFRIKCVVALINQGFQRMSLAGAANGGKDDDNFVAAGGTTLAKNLSIGSLLRTCLAEDTRRMADFDRRLLRPRIVPFFVNIIVKFLK